MELTDDMLHGFCAVTAKIPLNTLDISKITEDIPESSENGPFPGT